MHSKDFLDRSISIVGCWLCLTVSLHTFSPQTFAQDSPDRFREESLLPKLETGATRFLQRHPEYDGRGVLVAIFDTGVDPGAAGLQVTTDGQPKIVDIIDATGDGDVWMSDPVPAQAGKLTGATGRTLKVGPHWSNPTGKFRVGMKAAYDLFPGELVQRLKSERRDAWLQRQREREVELIAQLASEDSNSPQAELRARLEVLRKAVKSYDDPGPVYDCVTFHDGDTWRAVVDTDADGDLQDEQLLTDYRLEHQFATFDEASRLNFSVNVYEDGQLLSLVTVCGDHGTHVAGIVAANFPDRPQRNGIAPGAQLVSVKIGDNRIDGMETGAALMRGIKRVAEMQCDLINMSYGEPSAVPDQGELIEAFNSVVREQQVIFVASAGNSGPALTTVGSPGGTTSAVIGVGAYVSPEMAQVEYSLRNEIQGLPYTWTSRGPTSDGDWGVDIFAPGGAVAPVPTYSLQPNRRMNGTSMASPNACGNIALLLSGLKQSQTTYTPASVLRSVQSTAKRLETVDPFAQGPGLIQVDAAYDHHVALAEKYELIEYDVRVINRRSARGIYLRDAAEQRQPFEALIRVRPQMDETADNDAKLALDVPVILKVDADWVDVGSHLLVTHGGGSFDAEIDATKLKPGVHHTEILGLPADAPERGPLFRVPVVVTKPEQLRTYSYSQTISSHAGQLSRTFFEPPSGSRYAEIRLKHLSDRDRSFIYLHTVQLLEGRTFEDQESKTTLSLIPGEELVKRIPVVAGRTLEVCVAQYWSSLGETTLQLDVVFDGVATASEQVVLSAAEPVVPIDLLNAFRFNRLEPKGAVSTWNRRLLPVRNVTQLLSRERHELWNHQQQWQLVLDYEFELDSNKTIQLTNPPLTGLLYDAPVASHRIMLFDDNDRLVWTEDMYPTDFRASSGKYTARVEVRHASRDALKNYESLPLVVSVPINDIRLTAYPSRTAALERQGSIGRVEMQQDERQRLWLSLPPNVSLPKQARNGDTLTGKLSLIDDDPHPLQVTYLVVERPEPSAEQNAAQPVTNLERAEVDFWLQTLATLDWSQHQETIQRLVNRIDELSPNDRRLLVAKLHLADNDDRKQRLGTIVELANDVIAAVPQKALRSYFGSRNAPETAAEKKQHAEMESARKDLIDALYRKGRALAYMELPEVVKEHPIENAQRHEKLFEKNFQQLSAWVDTTDKEYFLLHVRRLRRQGRFAQAIQELNKHDASERPQFLHDKKRRDLYELLEWQDWQDYQQHWMWREFPSSKLEF